MPTATDVFAKVRGHERVEQFHAARDADLLPYFRRLESPAAPVVEMEGAERIMLGSNNYLGLTGDPRVMQGARDALERYGTGPDRVAAPQRHARAAPGARGGAGRLDGHGGRDRLHHGPPGQRGHAGDDPRAGRHRDRRLGRPRLDPRRLPALAGQAAAVPPQPARPARADAGEGRGRRRRRARGGRRRLLDGGRRRAAPADRGAVRALRRPPDGGRGARRRRARGARRGHRRAVRRRGPLRPADGDVLEEPRLVRRLRGRLARGDRVPAHPVARLPLHRGGRARRGRRGAGRAADHPLRRRAPGCSRACWRTPPTSTAGCTSWASMSWSRSRWPATRR